MLSFFSIIFVTLWLIENVGGIIAIIIFSIEKAPSTTTSKAATQQIYAIILIIALP